MRVDSAGIELRQRRGPRCCAGRKNFVEGVVKRAGQRSSDARVDDVGVLAQARRDAFVHVQLIGRRRMRVRRKRDARGEEMGGLDAKISAIDRTDAANKRADADQKCARERNFADDEHAAHAREGTAGDAACPVAKIARSREVAGSKRRQETGGEGGEQCGAECQQQHRRVDVESEPLRIELGLAHDALLPGDAGSREHERDRARRQRQQYAFGEQVRDQAATACTERDAYGKFLRATERSREQEVRRVRAGNEQHHDDRGEHAAERAARRAVGRHAGERLAAERTAEKTVGIRACGIGEPAVQCIGDIRVADTGIAARNHPISVRVRRQAFDDRRRYPEIFVARIGEIFRHDADHCRGLSIDPDFASNDRCISAIACAPERVRKHRYCGRAGLCVFVGEIATQCGSDAEDMEQIRCDVRTVIALGAVHVAEIDRRSTGRCDIGFSSEIAPDLREIAAVDRKHIAQSSIAMKAGLQEFIGPRERQRTQDESVQQREHENHARKPGAENAGNERGESGILEARAERVAKIVQDCVHRWAAPVTSVIRNAALRPAPFFLRGGPAASTRRMPSPQEQRARCQDLADRSRRCRTADF